MAELDQNKPDKNDISAEEKPVPAPIEADSKEIDQSEPVAQEVQPVAYSVNSAPKEGNRLTKIKVLVRNKKFYIPAIVITLVLVLLLGLTSLKYSVFGIFVKKNVVVEVVDEKTLQPISGVNVRLAGASGVTDGKGEATINGVHPGKKKIEVEKEGYTAKSQDVLITFSTRKVEAVRITGTGYPLPFTVKDKISGAPINNAKLSLGGVESFTNEKGEALARVSPTGSAKLTLTTSKDGYNTLVQEVEVKENAQTTEVALTPAGSAIYVSNKAKKYDVYASDLDGKNERIILPGTGKEDQNTYVMPSSTGDYVALISGREGNEIYGLFVIDVKSGELKKVENNPSQIAWSGNTLVYSNTEPNTYATTISSYNAESKQIKKLLDQYANYEVANGKIYLSLSDANKPDYGIFVMNTDGSGKKKLDNRPFNMFRYTVGSIGLAEYDSKESAELKLSSGTVEKSDKDFTVAQPLKVVSSKDNKSVIYSRVVDTFPQLFRANADGTDEKQLTKSVNVSSEYYITPNGNYALFYGAVGTDAGIYILSIDGGTPMKIASAHIPQRGPGGY